MAVLAVLVATTGCSTGHPAETPSPAPPAAAAEQAAPSTGGSTPAAAPQGGHTAEPARTVEQSATVKQAGTVLASKRPSPRGQLHRHLLSFRTGAAPKQVAFTPDGRELWVTPLGSASGVEVYEPATGRRTARIRLGSHGAVEVIFTRDGRTAFVSQMETASVYAIDTASKQVRRRYGSGGTWTKVLTLSPDERTLYAANWVSNDVSAIDLASGEVRRYPTVRTPRGLFVSPDGGRLYVAGYDKGEIARIALATGDSKVLLRTGGAMRHLVGDPARGLVYADDMARNRIYVLDLRTEQVRPLAKTDHEPNTIDVSPDGRAVYVSNRGRNGANWYRPGPEWGSVIVLDTETGRPLDAIVGGNQTTGLDLSPDGTRLAFSDFLDNRVNIYEVPTHDVLLAGKGGRYGAHLADLRK